MPTYEYECRVCKHRFEVFQSMSDEPIKECVKCGAEVRKLIQGGAGIIFKGSGFYKKDYASGVSSRGGAKETESASDTAPACPGSCASCPVAES
ncbi:MAG TPA: zinc ribbon domain-containing protein [Spirochaetota bacterium]|nr:zinc ribbon domain-containing protein [Spirochaetota bacterium]HQO02405.1 zinc ribbon domain-containing protein [Spirochaetota bacterium]HQP47809.1 zinc ribbon domain-containing protein [Spirochaetota bacterium]